MVKKAVILLGMIAVILSVCILSNTRQLLMMPNTTPEAFLSGMPYTTISLLGQDYILIQPSSTFFVYFLGLLMVALGLYFVVTWQAQQARAYWGLGFIFWGISALVAGTSYQAFGFELKCRGQDYCLYTSSYELVYMLLTAYCINFLVVATGYTSVREKIRKYVVAFAIGDSVAYSVYMLIGAIIPIRFLVSYEGFMTFIGINFVMMFVFSLQHYRKHKDRLNRNLVVIWIGFLCVNLGYFGYLFSGLGPYLYSNFGLWFNENDTLHLLLILWTVGSFFLLRKDLMDNPNKP